MADVVDITDNPKWKRNQINNMKAEVHVLSVFSAKKTWFLVKGKFHFERIEVARIDMSAQGYGLSNSFTCPFSFSGFSTVFFETTKYAITVQFAICDDPV